MQTAARRETSRIDHVDRLSGEISADVRRQNVDEPPPRFQRRPPHMRRKQTVAGVEQRMLRRRRFRLQRVDPRSGDLAGIEGIGERRAVDQTAAGGIDEQRIREDRRFAAYIWSELTGVPRRELESVGGSRATNYAV